MIVVYALIEKIKFLYYVTDLKQFKKNMHFYTKTCKSYNIKKRIRIYNLSCYKTDKSI